MRPGRMKSRVAAVALAGATIFSLSGCWYPGDEIPVLDPPELKLELRVSPTYCTGLWHMPNRHFTGSLSWALAGFLVETEDGSELPEFDDAQIMVDGLPDARASVDEDGVLVGVLPLTARGGYKISGLVVGLKDGIEYPFTADYDLEVGVDGYDVTCEGDEADAETIKQGILLSPLVDF